MFEHRRVTQQITLTSEQATCVGDTFLQTWWRHKLILISDDLRVSTFTANLHLWENNSFKHKKQLNFLKSRLGYICCFACCQTQQAMTLQCSFSCLSWSNISSLQSWEGFDIQTLGFGFLSWTCETRVGSTVRRAFRSSRWFELHFYRSFQETSWAHKPCDGSILHNVCRSVKQRLKKQHSHGKINSQTKAIHRNTTAGDSTDHWLWLACAISAAKAILLVL